MDKYLFQGFRDITLVVVFIVEIFHIQAESTVWAAVKNLLAPPEVPFPLDAAGWIRQQAERRIGKRGKDKAISSN